MGVSAKATSHTQLTREDTKGDPCGRQALCGPTLAQGIPGAPF